MEQAPDWFSFVRERPILALVLAVIACAMSSSGMLKLLPETKPIVDTGWFWLLDPAREILALGFALFVGYRYSVRFGAILLAVHFLAHVPYFALTYPVQVPESLAMILELIVGTWFLATIEKLHNAASKAEKAAEMSSHAAKHDTLTNLPNRMFFKEAAKEMMAQADDGGGSFAVLFIDLDNFKDVNDALGHEMGDKLLKIVSGRLRESMREGDIVARLGGDEFAILAKNSRGIDGIIDMTDRLIKRVSEPIFADGHMMHTTPSIGIAPYPFTTENEKVTDVVHLLRHADIAMYQAKSSGGKSFEFFDHEISEVVLDKHALLNDLRCAVDRGEMVLYYQPQIDLRTGKMIGAEALVRWDHPKRGIMAPEEFIHMAESSGVIMPLGEWVIRTAATQNRNWQLKDYDPIKINVNVSPAQLHGVPIVRGIKRILDQVGLDPKYLDLELTENILMKDVAFSAKILGQLRELGVMLSIDDFGTGYSSLSCLQDFSVDTLKIDKAFVKNISNDPDSQAIATAMIHLGHSLGLTVIAEGVENEDDLELLKSLGCDQAQGYFFSRPIPASRFNDLHKRNSNIRSLWVVKKSIKSG